MPNMDTTQLVEGEKEILPEKPMVQDLKKLIKKVEACRDCGDALVSLHMSTTLCNRYVYLTSMFYTENYFKP